MVALEHCLYLTRAHIAYMLVYIPLFGEKRQKHLNDFNTGLVLLQYNDVKKIFFVNIEQRNVSCTFNPSPQASKLTHRIAPLGFTHFRHKPVLLTIGPWLLCIHVYIMNQKIHKIIKY